MVWEEEEGISGVCASFQSFQSQTVIVLCTFLGWTLQKPMF